MITLRHGGYVRIGTAFAQISTVGGTAAEAGQNAAAATAKAVADRKPLTWATAMRRLPVGQIGREARERAYMQAEELRPGQAIEVEGRRYSVALADRSPAGTIRIVPHNPDEARSGR
jgi:hypothetical protein